MKKFIEIASAISEHGEHRHKLGAVIFRKNEIITTGFNKMKSHPLQLKYNNNEHKIFLHAEIDAIIKAKGRTEGNSIIVVRKMSLGEFGTSKPCAACLQAIIASGIKRVTFFEEGEFRTIRL